MRFSRFSNPAKCNIGTLNLSGIHTNGNGIHTNGVPHTNGKYKQNGNGHHTNGVPRHTNGVDYNSGGEFNPNMDYHPNGLPITGTEYHPPTNGVSHTNGNRI